MTRTLLISSFLCGALTIGCGDKGEDDTGTTNTTKTTPATSAETGGNETTGDGGATEAASDPTTGGGGSDPTNPTGGPDGTTTGASATTDGPGDTEDTCNFLCGSTGDPGPDAQCDVFAQDCPEGEKCTAYAQGGGSSWNATKCVPVTGEGVPGDVCTTEGGGVSGLDDCAKGNMCWDVDAENKGVCIELCGGSEAAPTCSNEQDFNCAVVNEGVLNLCLPGCDPLIQDCPGDDLCILAAETFVCVLDASGEEGQALDPCEFANACDKGLLCLNPSASSSCDPNAGGCCMPFCDLSSPDANAACQEAAMDTECVPLFEEGMAPPEYETVGLCAIPA